MTTTKRATLLVAAAYVWWGVSPVFWRQLDSVEPVDQLSWRVSLGLGYLLLVAFWRRSNPFRSITRRHVGYGVLAATMIASNWAGFLWAIDNDRTVEAALGYFLMPLISVALGVGLLGERLRPLQTAALLFATIGMCWTLYVVGTVPWVALVLGVSFAVYGWARKQGPWDSIDGLTFELSLMAPIFVLVLMVRAAGENNISGDGSAATMILIALTGLVTIVPLLLFASAARRVPLTVVGLFQYINPVLQFLIGWQIFGEEVTGVRLVGFAWIWIALGLVATDELRSKGPIDGLEASGDERFVRS